MSSQEAMNKKTPKATRPAIDPEADSKKTATPADLARVVEKAEKIIALETELAAVELKAKDLSQRLTAVQTVELPELMEGLGLKDFTLKNGSRVTIKPIVSASIPTESAIEKARDPDAQAELRDRFTRALKYLADNGAGSLIKNLVFVELGKDSVKEVEKAKKALKKAGFTPVSERGVHGQTLTSWVRERLAAGAEVDLELLNVYTGSKAEITAPKGSPKKSVSIF